MGQKRETQPICSFFRIFSDDIRGNELIISLIILIVLFSPRETITDEHDKKLMSTSYAEYTNLLQRYKWGNIK